MTSGTMFSPILAWMKLDQHSMWVTLNVKKRGEIKNNYNYNLE